MIIIADKIAADFADCDFEWIAISAQIEEEISLLDDETREEFLADLGIEHPALDRLTLLCYKTLGLISFFTVVNDEVPRLDHSERHPITAGGRARFTGTSSGDSSGPKSSDYEDLIALGDEQKVKAAGKLTVKGKDAEIFDGDVIHFLFKV